jgi:hypothetical protein
VWVVASGVAKWCREGLGGEEDDRWGRETWGRSVSWMRVRMVGEKRGEEGIAWSKSKAVRVVVMGLYCLF